MLQASTLQGQAQNLQPIWIAGRVNSDHDGADELVIVVQEIFEARRDVRGDRYVE
jgi:hypothetical protein